MAFNNTIIKYFQAKKHFGKLDSYTNETDLSLKPKLCREILLKKQFELM